MNIKSKINNIQNKQQLIIFTCSCSQIQREVRVGVGADTREQEKEKRLHARTGENGYDGRGHKRAN